MHSKAYAHYITRDCNQHVRGKKSAQFQLKINNILTEFSNQIICMPFKYFFPKYLFENDSHVKLKHFFPHSQFRDRIITESPHWYFKMHTMTFPQFGSSVAQELYLRG